MGRSLSFGGVGISGTKLTTVLGRSPRIDSDVRGSGWGGSGSTSCTLLRADAGVGDLTPRRDIFLIADGLRTRVVGLDA